MHFRSSCQGHIYGGGVLQEQTRTDILVTTFLCTGEACGYIRLHTIALIALRLAAKPFACDWQGDLYI